VFTRHDGAISSLNNFVLLVGFLDEANMGFRIVVPIDIRRMQGFPFGLLLVLRGYDNVAANLLYEMNVIFLHLLFSGGVVSTFAHSPAS
jgi:hypothetical protein